MRSCLTLFLVVCGVSAATAQPLTDLVLLVEPDRSTYLWNPTKVPVHFNAYRLQSFDLDFDPNAWQGIARTVLQDPSFVSMHLGTDALDFVEVTADRVFLYEGIASSLQHAELRPGERYPIGRIFKTSPVNGLRIGATYQVATDHGWDVRPMDIVPEPSTGLLAVLAIVCVMLASIRTARQCES